MKDRFCRTGLPAVLSFCASAATILFCSPGVCQQLPQGKPIQLAQIRTAPSSVPQKELLNVFLPAPRDYKQHLSRAITALEEDRFSEAVSELGRLLERLDTDRPDAGDDAGDFFVGPHNEAGTRTSLRAEAQRLLGSMPAKGRREYELQFGAEARMLLDESLNKGDIDKLMEVTRKFFHTKAGYEATILLGRHHFDYGRPLAGALCLKRLAETPVAAAEYDPELSMLLATCWLCADMPERARQMLVQWKQRHPRATVRVGAEEIRLFEKDDNALAWLEQAIGTRRKPTSNGEDQWVMYRGNPQRNARSDGCVPLMNYRWFVPLAVDPEDEQNVEQLRQRYVDQRLPALPAFQPVVVGDTVLIRSPWRLYGVDFITGKRLWYYPSLEDQPGQPEAPSPHISSRAPGSPRMQRMHQRIWEDAAFGQISSDGQQVFVIDELGYASINPYTHRIRMMPGGFRQTVPGQPKTTNRLAALDVAQQGKLKWMVPESTDEKESRLAGAFFLGAPLPLGKRLYVLAEIKKEIRLVALDAQTGKLEWSQQLAHVDSRPINRDMTRRLAAASPSFADGVLICPTSAGAIVAVDVSNRSLLWGYQYEQARVSRSHAGVFHVGVYPRQAKQPGEQWADATITIADGRVLATPVESSEMHCLDLVTGKLQWKKSREDALFVGCIDDGKVLLVGKNAVSAVRLADGKPAWKTPSMPLPGGAMPSGRGFLCQHYYYQPTTASEIVKIDVRTGQASKPYKTREVLGNLICHKDAVISQGANRVSSFFQLDSLRGQVTERLDKNPKDAWALARQAELLLHDGRRNEALAVLRRAYQAKPDDEVQTLLVDTLLEALSEDFEGNRQLAAEVESLINRPDQRMAFLRLTAAGLHESGKPREAFEAYMKIADLDGAGRPVQPGTKTRSELENVDRFLRVRRDRWVRTRLAALWKAAGDDDRAEMDAAIRKRFDAAVTADSAKALRRFIGYFAMHNAADEARLQLADRLIAAGDLLAADVLLERLQDSSETSLAAGATARRAGVLETAEHFDEAAALYLRLAQKWGDVKCLNGKTGLQLLDAVPPDSPVGRAVASKTEWPHGKVKVSSDTNRTPGFSSYRRIYPLNVRHNRSAAVPGRSVSLDPMSSAIFVRDGLGRRTVQIPLVASGGRRFYSSNMSLSHGAFRGHLLVLWINYEVIALDTLKSTKGGPKRDLWRHDLSKSVPGSPISRSRVSRKVITNPWMGPRYVAANSAGRPVGALGPLTEDGICFVSGHELICKNPISGETVWIRNDVQSDCDLFGDEEVLIVVPAESVNAMVLRASDGHLLQRVTVPRYDRRWVTVGRNVLTWEEIADNKLELILYDPITSTEVWSREYAAGSKGCPLGDEEIGILQPDGRFELLSLADGEVRIEAKLDPEPEFATAGLGEAYIHLMRSSDQYLLLTHTPVTHTTAGVTITSSPDGTFAPMFHGRVYAFDRQTGEKQWPAPAYIDRYALPLDQPVELPVLTFLRHVRKTERGRPTRMQTDALCIDRRDGRILLKKEGAATQTGTYEVVGDPSKKTVSLLLPSKRYTMQFSDEPRPPEPSAQTGTASSEYMGPGHDPQRVGNAIFRALERGIEPPADVRFRPIAPADDLFPR